MKNPEIERNAELEDIVKTLQERPEILELLLLVHNDKKLIDCSLGLVAGIKAGK